MPPEIKRIINRCEEFEGKPGTHALIVGVSDYPHLLDGTGDLTTHNLGLHQLSSTALTAYEVYSWLKEWQDRLETPLVTCRLLLSPSPTEKDVKTCLENLPHSYPATRENFEQAAKGWRKDANSHVENITFFYFAGHGAGLTGEDTIMLLEDFGSDEDKPFGGAVDSQNLVSGMKETLARTQIYFIDSCRVAREELRDFKIEVDQLWQLKLGAIDDRVSPVFYAALPGGVAYGIKGKQTYFGEALLDCLRGRASDRREFEKFDNDERWYISIGTLSEKIKQLINALNKDNKRNQTVKIDGTGNLDDEKIICFLDEPPEVDVVFKVNPPEACQYTKVKIFKDKDGIVSELPLPLSPHPYKHKLKADNYKFNVEIKPPQRSLQGIPPPRRSPQDAAPDEPELRVMTPRCEKNLRVMK